MRDSTAVPQIVKIVRMVVKFHPLLTITSLICWVILLQYWIGEETSNQWKALKVYCQSTIRALLDPIAKKMKNLSEALQMHLENQAKKGQPKAKLIGKLALFSTTFLLLDTEVSLKYDQSGAKTKLLLLIGLDLLQYSKLLSQLEILHRRCGCTENSTSNFTFFILAIVFAKFYDNSLRSLSSMLFISVYLLSLLVVLRPQTDLGLFSFIMGVIGSITYNNFEFTSPTWIIASICFVLFSFKSWLDKYWLNLEQDQSLTSTNTMARSTSVRQILSLTVVHFASTIFVNSIVRSPLSNYKVWLVWVISSVIWNIRNIRLHKLYPKDTSLPPTNMEGVSGLVLTIVNVAQGMFVFAFFTSPLAKYKDWLFATISYVVFCFWLRYFFPKHLLPPSTNTKGISSMILSLLSIAAYGLVVLTGLEPRLHFREWLVIVTCYVLWWVQLRTSLPEDLLPSITIEFKAMQWLAVVLYSMVSDIISWTITTCINKNT